MNLHKKTAFINSIMTFFNWQFSVKFLELDPDLQQWIQSIL